MTEQLRALLHDLGDDQPVVQVDPGTYTAGRRAHRRRVAARAGAAVAVVAALAVAVPPMTGSDAPQPADGKPVPALPSVLHEVPERLTSFHEDGVEWHEGVLSPSLEIGPTAAILPVNGGAVMAVSALDGSYQGLELPGFDESSYFRFESTPVALSPDGTRLAYTWNPDVIDGDALERDPATGVRIADLVSGEVADVEIPAEFGVYAFGFGWSPDGRYIAYNLQIVTDENGGVSGSRNYVVERLDTTTGKRVRTPLRATEDGTAVNDAGAVAVAGGGYNAVWIPGEGGSTFDGDLAGVGWAPDGRRLALGSWRGALAVADRDGVRRELSGPRPDSSPSGGIRVLGWADAQSVAVLDLATNSVELRPLDGGDPIRLIDAPEVSGLDQMSLATGLLSSPTRDVPVPDWPTDWSGLWLRLSALALVPVLLLAWLLRHHRPSRRLLRP